MKMHEVLNTWITNSEGPSINHSGLQRSFSLRDEPGQDVVHGVQNPSRSVYNCRRSVVGRLLLEMTSRSTSWSGRFGCNSGDQRSGFVGAGSFRQAEDVVRGPDLVIRSVHGLGRKHS